VRQRTDRPNREAHRAWQFIRNLTLKNPKGNDQ
jgi:hypothetical protein